MTDSEKFLAEVRAAAAQVLSATPIPQRAGFYCKAPEGFIYREHEIRQAKATERLVAMVEAAYEWSAIKGHACVGFAKCTWCELRAEFDRIAALEGK